MKYSQTRLLQVIVAGILLITSNVIFAATYPDRDPVRAWHFVLKPIEVEHAKRMVDMAERAGFNTVVVQITWGVNLNSAPWRQAPDAWSRAQLQEWAAYARKHGMAVVPEIKLLTHQNKLLQDLHPHLMFNRETYNPANDLVYTKVFAVLDEVIELIHPQAIHIGHDEVAGHSKKSKDKFLKPGEVPLPADLFLYDTLKIHQYLKTKGIETWMWGDMLISQDEFPEMRPNSLHGQLPGYGKAMREKLPRDIVICDWHYADVQQSFPSLATFKREGFRVLGATWKKEKTIRNFSRYAATHKADGMIATTWVHVSRKEWDIVNRIIETSGKLFAKDFPNAK